LDKKKQQEEILNLGHTIALQAVELLPQEREIFVKGEIANVRQIYGLIHPDEELLGNMEEWVTEIVKILAGSDNPTAGDGPTVAHDKDKLHQ